jgi:hypothetical protein
MKTKVANTVDQLDVTDLHRTRHKPSRMYILYKHMQNTHQDSDKAIPDEFKMISIIPKYPFQPK